MLTDMEAVCPTCGMRWRAKRDNTFGIVIGRAWGAADEIG
jgi:hypothetical protein